VIDIYCHTSPSGKRYVGVAMYGWRARWVQHISQARAGSEYLLHRAIRKYGESAFKHELLEQCDTYGAALLAEQRWVRCRQTRAPRGYNATDGGDGFRGSHGERTRALVGAASKARFYRVAKTFADYRNSPENIARLASFNTNRVVSEGLRARRAAALVGRSVSDTTRAKTASSVSKSWARMTPEQRAKRCAAMVRGRQCAKEKRGA
jgi:hypothetical protein